MLPLHSHIWVNASAGTGKTTILTNRVLQLLLSGVSPSTILCLTYTNAAAAEMKLRIMERLGKWVIIDETELRKDLETLIDSNHEEVLKCARGLFFTISESPDSLNIQTIHSFCQSILRRFPIEAGISPYFTVIDEAQSMATIEQIVDRLLFEIQQSQHPEIQQHIETILLFISDYSLKQTIAEMIHDSGRWRQFLHPPNGLNSCHKQLQNLLELKEEEVNAPQLLSETRKHELKQLASYFGEQKQRTLQQLANEIETLLSLKQPDAETLEYYSQAWLTKDNTLKSIIAKQCEQPDAIAPLIQLEADRVLHYRYSLAHARSYQLTNSLYAVVDYIWKHYEQECYQYSYIDYYGLLEKTAQFLTNQEHALGWVMYKLDGGIDHVLVDEAQDTNPLQWHIIRALTAEYFSGKGRKELPRTLFVVGDEKQSIFGFQGADLHEYRAIKQWISSSAANAKQSFHEVDLQTSYRSTPEVITAVNRISDAVDFNSHHIAHRSDEGRVTIWPLVDTGKQDGKLLSAEHNLAIYIAQNIQHWLDNKQAHAEDIMILVRRRSALSIHLASELRKANIPVQGVERMVLRDHLAVQDVLALLQWLLLPSDDYSLACVFRSPIGEISEEQLYQLCYDRGDTNLWDRLQAMAEEIKLNVLVDLLNRCKIDIEQQSIHAFLFSLLYGHGIANQFIKRMGQDVAIVLHALLDQAQQFEASHPRNYQLFVEYIKTLQHEITSNETQPDCIHIMTIHGAKGLEAPIVILADTTDQPVPISGFSWIDMEGTSIPCWLPGKYNRKSSLMEYIEHTKQQTEEEDKRLLYVAMTRARDRLYITGTEPKGKRAHWYQLLKEQLTNCAEFAETKQALDDVSASA